MTHATDIRKDSCGNRIAVSNGDLDDTYEQALQELRCYWGDPSLPTDPS